jgi:hypothetical protein
VLYFGIDYEGSEKSARKKERIGWFIGTAAGGYLLTR